MTHSDPTIEAATKAAVARLVRLDGWQNIATNLNVPGKDPRIETKFVDRGELALPTIESMYREKALFARIVDAIPEHATRRWIRISGTGGSKVRDFGKSALDALEDLDAQNKFCEFMRLDRLYGGACMLLGVDDGRAISQPIDVNNIRSVDFLNVLSRWEISVDEIDRDPTSATFRQPLSYTLGTKRVHSSRVLRLTGIQISDRIPRPGGWGYSVGEHVYDAIRRFGIIYDYMEALFKDLSQGVMKIKDLSLLLSGDVGCNELLIKRLELLNYTSSAFNAVLLDDDETYERRQATFTGIRDGIIAVMDELAAVAEMPLSILFGQPPAGLSTDDSAGRIAFYDSIANKQRKLLRAPINRVLELIFASRKIKAVPKDWFFEFLSLTEPTDMEQAEKRKLEADTSVVLVNGGIIDAEEARTALSADPYCPYSLKAQAPDLHMQNEDQQVQGEPSEVRSGGASVANSGDTMAPSRL